MAYNQFLDSQTQVIDLLLEELSQLTTEATVNFNNTKQLDTLLRHLEATLDAPVFCSVPSENVVQMLFSLSARCPASNWSHGSVHSSAGDTTEYMKQMNMEYDSCLSKTSLQKRSHQVLTRYLGLMLGQSGSPAVQNLTHTILEVLGTCYRVDITLFFLPSQLRPSTKRNLDMMNVSGKIREPRKAKVNAQGRIDAPSPKAVEVISDTDESDNFVDPKALPEIAIKYHSLDVPHKTVSSFSELSTHTSGLGETASLFKQMPHLGDTSSPEPGTPKPKKPKVMSAPWKRIQLFEEHMISAMLLSLTNYDVWSLLRWTLACADISSDYQKFLFNSLETHVSQIYRSNRDFLGVFLGFCRVDLGLRVAENKVRKAVIAQVLLSLGPRHEWHERAIEYTFGGLGIPSYDKPYPCFERELTLMRNDPVVSNARCKTIHEYDDNKDSMGLRAQLLLLLVDYERALANPLSAAKDLSHLIGHAIRKLLAVQMGYVRAFFVSLQCETEAQGKPLCFPSSGYASDSGLLAEICMGLIHTLTGSRPVLNAADDETLALKVASFLLEESLYRSIIDDVTFETVDAFVAKWDMLVFLSEWLLDYALQQLSLKVMTDEFSANECRMLLEKCKLADKLAKQGYNEFLESRYEDSDLLPETCFTLTRHEIDQSMARFTSSFTELAGFRL